MCNPDMVLMEASWTCIGRGGGVPIGLYEIGSGDD